LLLLLLRCVGYSFLLPFTGFTWAMLMVALVATMLLLTLLDAVTRNARLHAFERLHGSKNGPKKRKGKAQRIFS
jgi:carbon starvation protein CstA